jgi:hypothetical protein
MRLALVAVKPCSRGTCAQLLGFTLNTTETQAAAANLPTLNKDSGSLLRASMPRSFFQSMWRRVRVQITKKATAISMRKLAKSLLEDLTSSDMPQQSAGGAKDRDARKAYALICALGDSRR